MSAPGEPRTWTLEDWWAACRRWDRSPPADATASIEPATARVGLAGAWQVRMVAGPSGLGPAAHVAVEVPMGWRPDHAPAGPFFWPDPADGGLPLRVEAPGTEAELAWRASWLALRHGGFWVVDAVVSKGGLAPGQVLVVSLGEAAGRRVLPPLWAQESTFVVAVDARGDGDYRRTAQALVVAVSGGSPERLQVVGPATVRAGVPFDFSVQAQDGYGGNPAHGYVATVELHTGTAGAWIPEQTRLGADGPATKVVSGAVLEEPGLVTVHALVPADYLAGRSNPIAVNWMPDDWQVYFGDLHGHGAMDDGTGSVEDYFTWGREVARLDFCALTAHAEGRLRSPMDSQTWAEIVDGVRRHQEEKRFVTFLGFQWGDRQPGRAKCVYYLTEDGPCYKSTEAQADTPAKLWTLLRGGPPCLSVALGLDPDLPPEWSTPDEQMQPLVEIYSNWGPRESGPGPCVQRTLAAGWRLGFTAGSDTPFGRPGSGIWPGGRGGGLTAVLARELLREQIFAGLRRRRTYATTGARVLLWFGVDDLMMGQSGRVGSMPVLQARVRGTGPLERTEIIKNNEVLLTRCDEGPELHLSVADKPDLDRVTFYYLRVTQRDGHMAWSSPIWVRPKATQVPVRAHARREGP